MTADVSAPVCELVAYRRLTDDPTGFCVPLYQARGSSNMLAVARLAIEGDPDAPIAAFEPFDAEEEGGRTDYLHGGTPLLQAGDPGHVGLLDRARRFHRFAPPRARLRSAARPPIS